MITIHLTSDDLVKLRFAYRPLLEIPFSYRVLTNPPLQGQHRRWVEEARRNLYDVELPYLDALVTPTSRLIPHFLTPTPMANSVSIEDDLAELTATPDEFVRKYVRELIKEDGNSEMRQYFMVHPREAVGHLAEELRLYWQRTLAPHRSRMVSIKEGDVLYRARMLALDGPSTLFEDLHPTISYQPRQINIQPIPLSVTCDADMNLSGDGIQLVPIVITGVGRCFKLNPGGQPSLAYSVRGAGLWGAKPPDKSLELALGPGRASVLQALTTPASTGELALRLMVTAGAVSQHLDRLRQAGLVEAHRSGRRVYYQLTIRGEALIALFERMS